MASILDYLNPFSVLEKGRQENFERKRLERERGLRKEENCDCGRCGGKGYVYTSVGVPVGCAHCGGDGKEATH